MEEEELQRVLELSIHHTGQAEGGRRNWNKHSLASSSGAGCSSSQTSHHTNKQHSTSYVPATDTQTPNASLSNAKPPRPTPAVPQSSTPSTAEVYAVTRACCSILIRTPAAEPGALLAFERGGIIQIVDRWMGREGGSGVAVQAGYSLVNNVMR